MVSIIIPIFNVRQYIIACLESVEVQTYKDYEVILVDDCGTDGSMAIVEEYLNKKRLQFTVNSLHDCINTPKWRIIKHDRNRGLSAARNTGTRVAKGEYIYYLDSDDTITPNCLEKLVSEAERTEAELVVGNISILNDQGSCQGLKLKMNHHSGKNCVLSDNDNIFHSYLNDIFYMMAWNKLIRRDFLENHHLSFVEGLIHEDQAWSFSVACVAKKIALVYEDTYNYLVRENSIQTCKDYSKHYNAFCTLLQYYADEATKYGKADDCEFLRWYEQRKAFHFIQAKENGTSEQKQHIYSIIRKNLPKGAWNKQQIHYLLPSWLGIIAYRKWCGMWLM